jgi:hypothetical protein
MTDPDAKYYTRFLARQADSISVRDEPSKALLESIQGWDVPVAVLQSEKTLEYKSGDPAQH